MKKLFLMGFLILGFSFQTYCIFAESDVSRRTSAGTPQNLATNATPQFAGVNLSSSGATTSLGMKGSGGVQTVISRTTGDIFTLGGGVNQNDVTIQGGNITVANSADKTASFTIATVEKAKINVDGFTATAKLIGQPSAAQAITGVGSTFSADAAVIILNPDGDYTLTSAPTISGGITGQIVYVRTANTEANIVTVQDQGTLSSSNLSLGATSRAIASTDVLTLLYDGSNWCEVSYANN